MLRHRVYRLKTSVSLLGLELSDWVVLLLSWLSFKQSLTGLLGSRLSLLGAIIGTFLAFKLWQRIKDTMPDKFAVHLMTWLSEADSYRLYPDLKGSPFIVNVEPQET